MTSRIENDIDIVQENGKLKGYWDELGLDLQIAVVQINNSPPLTHIVLSTKHWLKVSYIKSKMNTINVWKQLAQISTKIGRKFTKNTKGQYVYITNLNLKQTESIFNIFEKHFGTDIHYAWELDWEIDGSTF